jgi:ketosteroid isomerase-like protein
MTAKEITDRVWETIEADDFDGFVELLHPDGIEFRGVGADITDHAELRGFMEAYKEGFPDLRHEVLDYVESGDTIALELHVRGTHTGTLRGPQGEIPATGRSVLWESADYVKVRDGKVTSWHVYNDQLAFLVQMGLAEDPSAQVA